MTLLHLICSRGFGGRCFAASAALVLATGALPSAAYGQFWDRLTNPTMEVPVTHPPQIVLRSGQKVAVMAFTGSGGEELTDRFIQALMESGKVEVVDRSHLAEVLREQGLQASAAVAPESAVTMGQLLGAGALFTGRVTRSSVTTSGLLEGGSYHDKKTGTHTEYVRKTTAHLVASVQLVDLATGRTHTARMVDVTKELVNELWDSYPEAPSESDAITAAYQQAIEELTRMILPWQEIVQLVVYDDDAMGLKLSAGQIKVGDFEGAVQTLQTQTNRVPQNEKERKLIAKVYYNLGIALMYSGRPEEAIPALQKSNELRPVAITTESIQVAKKMEALNLEHERKEAQSVEIGVVAAAPQKPDLTNEELIEMAQAGLPEGVLIAKIKACKAKLDSSPQALMALKKAGVSDAVVVMVAER